MLIWVPASAQTSDASVVRMVKPIRGNVYQASEGQRTTLFFVDAKGIVLIDPLNDEFAQWLKTELNERFPGRPVKYVVYSRLDFDRTGGATHYNTTAEVVAVEGFNRRLKPSRDTFPPRFAALDRDSSATLDRDELTSLEQSGVLLQRDFDEDGRLTPNELWSTVYTPETSYTTRRTITLGATRIELIHPGHALGDDATVIYFRSERLVFSTALPPLTAPFTERSIRPSELADWARTIALLDFDTLVTGDGQSFPSAQLAEFANYVNAIVAGVTDGYGRGRSLEQLQQGAAIAPFTGTAYGASRNADIEYIYRRTRLLTVDATGAVLVNKLTSDRYFCGPGSFCEFGPVNGIGGAAAIGLSIRRWRVMGEVNFGHDTNAVIGQPVWLTVHRRESLFSPLAGFRVFRSGTLGLTVLGGPTFARMSSNITLRTSNSPSGFEEITFKGVVRGYTFGADITVPLSARLQLGIPFRVTTRLPASPLDPLRTTTNLRVGVGLDIALSQRAY